MSIGIPRMQPTGSILFSYVYMFLFPRPSGERIRSHFAARAVSRKWIMATPDAARRRFVCASDECLSGRAGETRIEYCAADSIFKSKLYRCVCRRTWLRSVESNNDQVYLS